MFSTGSYLFKDMTFFIFFKERRGFMPTMQEELEEAGFEGMWEELEAGNLE